MVKTPLVYIGGSMKNRDNIRTLSMFFREAGLNVFNDWVMPGEQTDDKWREFEQAQGRTFLQALAAPHAQDVFAFDKLWLDQADAFVLVYPAGKSAHMELGYMVGRGVPAFVLMEEEPERWDVMLLFATAVVSTVAELMPYLMKREEGRFGWCLSKVPEQGVLTLR